MGGDAAGTRQHLQPGPEVLWDRESLGRGSSGSVREEKST